jgi:hypothetical protein
MLEKALSALAAVAIPTVGLLLQASRRNRLQQRIRDYLTIANEVAAHDVEAAAGFRRLASEAAQTLIRREERWLHRKIDPAAVVAILFLTVPAATVFGLAWTWESGWKWPTILLTAVWTLLWAGVGATQLWKERGDEDAVSAS